MDTVRDGEPIGGHDWSVVHQGAKQPVDPCRGRRAVRLRAHFEVDELTPPAELRGQRGDVHPAATLSRLPRPSLRRIGRCDLLPSACAWRRKPSRQPRSRCWSSRSSFPASASRAVRRRDRGGARGMKLSAAGGPGESLAQRRAVRGYRSSAALTCRCATSRCCCANRQHALSLWPLRRQSAIAVASYREVEKWKEREAAPQAAQPEDAGLYKQKQKYEEDYKAHREKGAAAAARGVPVLQRSRWKRTAPPVPSVKVNDKEVAEPTRIFVIGGPRGLGAQGMGARHETPLDVVLPHCIPARRRPGSATPEVVSQREGASLSQARSMRKDPWAERVDNDLAVFETLLSGDTSPSQPRSSSKRTRSTTLAALRPAWSTLPRLTWCSA